MKTFGLLTFFVLTLFSCNFNPPNSSNNSNTTTTGTLNQNTEYVLTQTGKKIRKAQQGITIANPNGWKTEDLTFHQSYCEQMMASIDTINATKFCSCFLDKIQYYYQPIFFKEAYEDQVLWNTECFKEAIIKK